MRRRSVQRLLLPLGVVVVGLLVWQISEDRVNEQRYAEGKTSIEFFVPTPRTIMVAARDSHRTVFLAMGETLVKAAAGFLVGAVFAIAVAVLFALVPVIRSATLPIAFAVQSFPIMGLAPAVVLAFGQDSFMSIVVISAVLTYFPVLLSLDDAFVNTEKEFCELGYVYSASTWQMLRFVKFPLAVRPFLTSIKLAAPSSVVGATIGEWMGSSSGIGRMITLALYQLNPGVLYCCLIALAIVSASTVVFVRLVERLCFPWLPLQRSEDM